MGNRNLRKKVAVFATAVLMTSIAFASDPYILDDFENTDKGTDVMNYNNGAWYLYDDNPRSWIKSTYDVDAKKFTDEKNMVPGGNSKFTKMNDTVITDADIKTKIIKNGDDTLEIKKIYPDVTATAGAGADNSRGLKLEFELGDTLPRYGHLSSQTYDGFVGFGTGLVPEGKFQKLDNTMEISFKGKVDISQNAKNDGATHLDVEFNIVTNQYVINLHGASYKVKCQFTEEWQTFTYKVDFGKDTDTEKDPLKFYQYNWWRLSSPPSDPLENVYFGWECEREKFVELVEADAKFEESEKLQWVIKNPATSSDNNGLFVEELTTIYIDDVTISNYTPTFDDEIQADKAWKNITDEKALIIYESGTDNTIGTGNGWYIYDDSQNDDGSEGHGNSKVTEQYITEDGENVGIAFELGNTFQKEIEGKRIQIYPFVGLAVGMYADANTETGNYDYTAGNFNGIQFTYKTNNGLDWVQVRMKDDQKLKADGASFNVKVPGTGGEWKTATIALKDFKLPWWDNKDPGAVLNTRAGKTIEFAYEGVPGTTGKIFVDDLTLVTNAEVNTPDIIPVISSKVAAKTTTFILNCSNNAINLRLPVGVTKAHVLLYTVRGQLVASQIIENGVTDGSISTESLAAGTYLLRAVSLEGSVSDYAKVISIAH